MHEIGNNEHFLYLFKQRIKDISIQTWRRKVSDSSKGMHYKCFKSNLDVEKYLFIDLNFRCRKTLANFPCSSHNLLIEKGQHQNIERDYRFCLFCLKETYIQ